MVRHWVRHSKCCQWHKVSREASLKQQRGVKRTEALDARAKPQHWNSYKYQLSHKERRDRRIIPDKWLPSNGRMIFSLAHLPTGKKRGACVFTYVCEYRAFIGTKPSSNTPGLLYPSLDFRSICLANHMSRKYHVTNDCQENDLMSTHTTSSLHWPLFSSWTRLCLIILNVEILAYNII